MANQGVPLSEAHRIAVEQGILENTRSINDKIVREYWAREVGLQPHTETSRVASEQKRRMLAEDISRLRAIRKQEVVAQDDAGR